MSKLCECGCGAPTTIIAKSNLSRGEVRGEGRRFLKGHNRRKDGVTSAAIHQWLNRRHPKTGICEKCDKNVGLGRAGTQYAFKKHPEPHTRDRDDYLELCPTCHGKYDAWIKSRGDDHWKRRQR